MANQTIRLGFMPLLDAAIPIVAADMGFAASRGLDLQLTRESSWANIRDRLAIGHFDAAHMLAPMSVAAALGLTPLDSPLIAPLALGPGGNAITVSDPLWQAMLAGDANLHANDPVAIGAALKTAIRASSRKLTFAVVHPYSAHNYELRYWLAASDVRPDIDIEIAILPPPLMPDALAAGSIDGFCVGEPWNSNAARRFGGRIILTKSAIWRGGPEKVLGLRADWAADHPGTVTTLTRVMIDAAQWCADPANTGELVDILSRTSRLNLPAEDIAAPLNGTMLLADGAHYNLGSAGIFGGGLENLPRPEAALWFLSQMARWGQASITPQAIERVKASFRPDLFLACFSPAVEDIASATHLLSSAFFDGRPFKPEDIGAYVAGQTARDRA